MTDLIDKLQSNKTLVIIVEVLLISGYLLLLLFFMNEKTNLHMDEVSSYVGANNSYDTSISINPKYNYRYEDSSLPWMQQMTVANGKSFDFKNVFTVQSYDNHPPLYMCILHAVCSLFPGTYSKWYAGIINIAFSIFTLIGVQLLVKKLTDDNICVLLASAFYCFSSGIISSATYFRMYHMCMFFVVLITYILICGLEKRDVRFYIIVSISVFLAVMTHFYMAIYVFFVSIAYVIILICKKNYKDTIKYIVSMIMAAALYMLMYPVVLERVFGGGDRSGEALENAKMPLNMMIAKIVRCFGIVDTQIFSRLGLIVLIIIAAVMIADVIKTKTKRTINVYPAIIIFSGIMGYMLVVSVVTVYVTPRYFYPVYALTLISLISLCYMKIKEVFNRYVSLLVVILLFLACSLLCFKENVHYLYRSTKPILDMSANMSDVDAIFVTKNSYDVNASFYEVSNYRSITFMNIEDVEKMTNVNVDGINCDNGLVLLYTSDCDRALIDEYVRENFINLTDGITIGEHGGNTSVLYNVKE